MTYLFDPTQFKELGYNFFEGTDFSFRYQKSRKIFFNSIYIPLGPNCLNEDGFDNFLEHIKSQRFTKVKIDLPAIYDPKIKNQVVAKLKTAGFKPTNYLQDEETILVTPPDLNLPQSEMCQVRAGLKKADIVIKDSLSPKELDQIYEIYLVATNRLGVIPKAKAVFKRISESCLSVIAYDKQTKQPEGFLLNYLTEANLKSITKNNNKKLLLLMYTGLTDKGRELKLGRAIYYELFREAFEKYNVAVCDFHGASRSKGRSYMSFKLSFSERFLSLPGSFTRTRLF